MKNMDKLERYLEQVCDDSKTIDQGFRQINKSFQQVQDQIQDLIDSLDSSIQDSTTGKVTMNWQDRFAWMPVTTVNGERCWLRPMKRRRIAEITSGKIQHHTQWATPVDILEAEITGKEL